MHLWGILTSLVSLLFVQFEEHPYAFKYSMYLYILKSYYLMMLDDVHLFNTILCYDPYLVSFLWNFACLTSNFVSVIVLHLGINFHMVWEIW